MAGLPPELLQALTDQAHSQQRPLTSVLGEMYGNQDPGAPSGQVGRSGASESGVDTMGLQAAVLNSLAGQLGPGASASNLAAILSSLGMDTGPGASIGNAKANEVQSRALQPFADASKATAFEQLRSLLLGNNAKQLELQRASGRSRGAGVAGGAAATDARQLQEVARARAAADLKAAQLQPGRDQTQYSLEVQSKKEALNQQHAALDNMLKEFELKKKTADLQQKLEEHHLRQLDQEAQRKAAYNQQAMGFAQQLMNAILG